MKAIKRILICAGTLSALAGISAALVCCDFVQTKIVLSALEKQGFEANADKISVGIFSRGISVENLQLSRNGQSFCISHASAVQECFLGFLPSRLALSQVNIAGTAETEEYRISTKTTPEKNDTAGDGKGTVVRREQFSHGTFSGEIESKADGSIFVFSLDARITDAGDFTLKTPTPFNISGTVADKKTGQITTGEISHTAAPTKDPAFSIRITHGAGEKFATLIGSAKSANGKLTGEIRLQIDSPETAFFPAAELLRGDAKLKISGDTTTREFLIENDFSLTIQKIATLIPEIDEFPNLHLGGNAKFKISPASLSIEKISAQFDSVEPAGELTALGAISIPSIVFCKTDTGKWIPQGKNIPALVNFSKAPLAVLNPILGEYAFSEGTLSGSTIVLFNKDEGDTNLLKSMPPALGFLADGVKLEKSGKTVFDHASIALEPQISCDAGTLRIKVRKSEIRGKFQDLPEAKLHAEAKGEAEISREYICTSSIGFKLFDETSGAPKELFNVSANDMKLRRCSILADLAENPFTVRAESFPLEFLNPPSPGAVHFTGTLAGTLLLHVNAQGIEIRDRENGVEIRDFTMRDSSGINLLEKLSLSTKHTSVAIKKTENAEYPAVEIAIAEADLRDARNTQLVHGDLRLVFKGPTLENFEPTLAGTLAGIGQQPMFRPISNLAAGEFSMFGKLESGSHDNAFVLDVTNLRSRSLPEIRIKKIALELVGEDTEDDVSRLRLTLDGENHSEVRIKFSELDFTLGENGSITFAAKALAPSLDISDIMRFGTLFAGEVATAAVTATQSETDKPEATASVEEFEAPCALLDRFRGNLDFTIQELHVPENTFRNIKGRLEATQEQFRIAAGTDDCFGGNAKGKLKLARMPIPRGFSLDVGIVANQARLAETVPMLRAKNPKPIDGAFDFSLRAHSEATTPEALLKNLSAKASISGKNGRVRIFSADNKKMQLVGGAAQIGSDLVGMLGGLARNVAPQANKIAGGTRELQKYLSDFPYDDFFVAASYRFGEPINFGEMRLRNDLVNFHGTGAVTPLKDAEFGDWPVAVSAKFSARGNIGETLRLIGIASGNADADGYLPGPEINFTGTLNRVSDDMVDSLYKPMRKANILDL